MRFAVTALPIFLVIAMAKLLGMNFTFKKTSFRPETIVVRMNLPQILLLFLLYCLP